MANPQKDRLREDERMPSKDQKQGKSEGLSERKSSEDLRKESSNKGRL
ncbi:MAG: hypothetical protein K0R65_1466 [Crocinitomicaceae bacterium]|jgi:hypothetical protein|nr:hypothetical protein [Crocinitomicaceae bacterium]